MFKRKVKVLEIPIDGHSRYILDFSRTKVVIEDVIKDIINNFENAILLFDSNISETYSSDIDKQISKLTEYFTKNNIVYDILKYDQSINKSITEKMFSKRKNKSVYAYKLVAVVDLKHFNDLIKLHLEYNTNIRIGLNFKGQKEKSERDFISNLINDDNRFDYYDIDFFYNYDLKRIALFSKENNEMINSLVNKFKEWFYVK